MNILIPNKITPDLAEETGWHIGDGSMNIYGSKGFYQLRGHIEDDKQHYITRIAPIFKKLYGLKLNLREMPSTRVFGFQVWNNELIEFKQKMGLPLGKKFDISIPKIFLKEKELKLSVLRGIFDTDGSINLEKKNNKLYPRIYISTICPTLACQLFNLFNEAGLRTTKYSEIYNKKFKRQRNYRITMRGEKMLHSFMQIIKPKNPKHLLKYTQFLNSKSL
jgi:DNA-binding transcriptional regulator WhiA